MMKIFTLQLPIKPHLTSPYDNPTRMRNEPTTLRHLSTEHIKYNVVVLTHIESKTIQEVKVFLFVFALSNCRSL